MREGSSFFDLVAFGLMVGWIRGGRFRNSPLLGLKATGLVLVSAALQLGASYAGEAHSYLVVAGYLSLMAFCALNLDRQSVRVAALGALLNLVVIVANGGRMPVDVDAAVYVGYDPAPLVAGGFFKHMAIEGAVRLGFLADIIPLKYPVPRVISLGDIFVSLGIFLLIQEIMGVPLRLRPAGWRSGSE